MYKVENCANSAISALRAQEAGAWRVELCAGMPEGGTTPSYGEIKLARRLLQIKLHVIIRPRGGDFLYNDEEAEIMLEDIRLCQELGVDGVVIGALTAEGDIDVALMRRLIAAAGAMSVTCHRAFDVCRDREQALEQLIELGCARVLTSGGAGTALDGAKELARLVAQAGERIIVMPGCGVNASNIEVLARRTGAREFHLSARSVYPSPMQYRHEGVSMGGVVHVDEYTRELTDPAKISAVVKLLDQLARQ